MTTWIVRGGAPLRGTLRLPSDLQIGQEALVWAALAEGASHLRGLSPGSEQRTLIQALRAMGVGIAEVNDGVHVAGVGLHGLCMPAGALSAGESPTTLELLAALLSAQHFGTRIEASGRALRHSLRTVLPLLRARGAQIAGRSAEDGDVTAPVAVAPLLEHERLSPVEIDIPSGDASAKRALLISGLFARGATVLNEGLLSRDHTERALLALGAPIETMGPLTLLDTSDAAPHWQGFTWRLPCDFSLAAYVIAAALGIAGSDVLLEDVALNRSRTAFFDALRHVGADITVTPKGDQAGNEPIGDIRVRASRLGAVKAMGELAQRLLDDVPALAALGAASRGRIMLRDAAALRLGGENVLKASVQVLRAFGAECTEYEDGFDLECSAPLHGAVLGPELPVSAKLLALALGLIAPGETQLSHADELDALYPGLRESLRALGTSIT